MENKELMNVLLAGAKQDVVKGGDLTCGAALSSGKTELLILAKDAKASTKTKFGQLGFRYDVPVITVGSSTEFSWITGKKDVQILAITDEEVAHKAKLALGETI